MRHVAVIGAGPAGLLAAETLARAGIAVSVHDRMPSPARKFLMAGRGGLNLTHDEPLERFLTHYRGSIALGSAIEVLPPPALRAWADELGQETFVGTSGRVFPRAMKASPLLRAWLVKLRALGVTLHMRETFIGFEGIRPILRDGTGALLMLGVDATILALGGASWPRLGSNGEWAKPLHEMGVELAPLAPANCGLHIAWSSATADNLAGQPLKRAAFTVGERRVRGEVVLTRAGLEGGAIYALASDVRERLAQTGEAQLTIDLCPDMSAAEAMARLESGRHGDSRANLLRKRLSLSPVALALLRESEGGPLPHEPATLVSRVKAVALRVQAVAGVERAISTAGGVCAAALDEHLMLRARPGVFVAGEMLDFDAPTGGYLLQAAFATGAMAAHGVQGWLTRASPGPPPALSNQAREVDAAQM